MAYSLPTATTAPQGAAVEGLDTRRPRIVAAAAMVAMLVAAVLGVVLDAPRPIVDQPSTTTTTAELVPAVQPVELGRRNTLPSARRAGPDH